MQLAPSEHEPGHSSDGPSWKCHRIAIERETMPYPSGGGGCKGACNTLGRVQSSLCIRLASGPRACQIPQQIQQSNRIFTGCMLRERVDEMI